jgi:Holliday junction resolvasome RuvABC endonuclease subunit
VIVLGLDPGFRAFGWVIVRIVDGVWEILALGVIRTKKTPGKKTLVRDDDARCGAEIMRELLRITRQWPPDVICAESLTLVRAIRGKGGVPVMPASKNSRAWGHVDALAEVLEVELLQAAPQTIKKKAAGAADASKSDVQAALDLRFNGALTRHLSAIRAKSMHEHPTDALGAIVALEHEGAFRSARRRSPAQGPRQRSLDELTA